MGLILASSSPRRKELLTTCGISLKAVLPSSIEEKRKSEESPAEYCSRLAQEKAQAVAERYKDQYPDDWILAADTVVSVNNDIYEKPLNNLDAFNMLQTLSIGWHDVRSSWFLLNSNEALCEYGISLSQVKFRPLNDEEIQAYIETGEGQDKAGGYGIQGLGAALVDEIVGSYSNVVGLPLRPVVSALRKHALMSPHQLGAH